MNEHRPDHPDWCDPAHCTVPDRSPLGARGGAHRSAPVPIGLEATVWGETGPVDAQLVQALRPGAGVFLDWRIDQEEVGHVRLEDAAPLALLIAAGMGVLEEQAETLDSAGA